MRPSSSSSEPGEVARQGRVGRLFGSPAVDALVSDGAWLCAMLEVEAALAAAGAGAGAVPVAAAAEIADACREVRLDIDDLGRRGLWAGNPVVPLVAALGEPRSGTARPYLRLGATSQDILDTALSLLARRALVPVLDDLAAVADGCAALAEAHRDTLMAGRTLLQQALPTTFGLRAAGWMTAGAEARSGLDRVRGGPL